MMHLEYLQFVLKLIDKGVNEFIAAAKLLKEEK